jgi:cell division cycle 2-like protein
MEDFNSKYEAQKFLGKGTYGRVYKYKNKDNDKFVAVKKYYQDDGYEEIEIDIMKNLNHRNIVKYIEHYIIKDKYFLVMEYLTKDLRSYMNSIRDNICIDLIQSYMYQLLLGTKYLHDLEYIHRDLKPANLLIDETGILKICDFGMSGKISDDFEEIGTSVWYRSPELCISLENQTQLIDIWAIGCIFAEMLTKKILFSGNYNDKDQLKCIEKVRGKPGKYKNIPGSHRCDENGKNLLNLLLSYNVEERITSDKAINHNYFNNLKKELYH